MSESLVQHRSKTSATGVVDEMHIHDSRMTFLSPGETGHLSCSNGTPVKKLERSLKHSISADSLNPAALRQSSTEGAVYLFGDKNIEQAMKEKVREYVPENAWISKLDLPQHSNGDSRRTLEPPLTSVTSRPPSGIQPIKKLQLRHDYLNPKVESPRFGYSHTPTALSRGDPSLDRSSSTSSSWSSLDACLNEENPEFIEAEHRFLEANRDYSETLMLEAVRREEYPDLRLQRQTYMDYANFALASKYQTEEHTRILMAQEHDFGIDSTSNLYHHVSAVHASLLKMFNTTKAAYSVVFSTSFRTAYRLVANAYPFRKGSPLLLCQDNHECVRQLLNAAVSSGAQPVLAPLGENDLCMTKSNMKPMLKRRFFHPSGSLFVYPAQSNITGIRHSLEWISRAHKSSWQVLLDVSTLLPTGQLDLSQHQPDFVIGSFENMVGYPSGMGYLLVKRSSFCVSVNRFPEADSTITLTPKIPAWQGEDFHIVCDDESPPLFLFASINFGIRHLQTLGLGLVNQRVKALALWIVHNLKSLRHEDEFWHLVNVYSPFTEENRGNIISFNVLECNGEHIKPTLVKRLAAKYRITLGVAACVNPGVANLLGHPKDRKKSVSVFDERYSSGFTCVQVSLGPLSNFEDAYRIVEFLMRFRDPEFVPTHVARLEEENHQSARTTFRRPTI
ncbi:uncharacterized protein [Physcomitrium patens]|uniref:Aminotransferase class V domain-containing protein n=1 Tax=Physcomitrium patens TaxID=3218 RepID=A0A7I4F2E4_PHYPA|nr:molybdenum cofactor sulfurase-like [Physcomitrium patens]|eukprot:XP_024391522.1 molybdenum cofactor sulfurase-like [Physcomitrella patens]